MHSRQLQDDEAASDGERLLNVLAEQMKLPLLQIARSAELARLGANPADKLDNIELAADGALKLLDGYLLSIKLARAHRELELEPISVAAVLADTAHSLGKLAKQYGCRLELHLAGRYEPVMAHRAGLEAALSSLGYVFIEAQAAAQEDEEHPIIKLAAHRSRAGIVAGMFAEVEGLTAEMYRRGKALYKEQAAHPLNPLTNGSGAGVFVAESLLSSMSAKLRIAHHQKLTGLAATFIPSQQLQLVGA